MDEPLIPIFFAETKHMPAGLILPVGEFDDYVGTKAAIAFEHDPPGAGFRLIDKEPLHLAPRISSLPQ